MVIAAKSFEFLVDNRGKPKAVILRMAAYRKLLSTLEALEDALDLKHAMETSSGVIDHHTLIARLKKSRLL
jgi:PHD/YefM family antitoxin component YafN of YafNO toxin-antitoxin module